MRFSAGNWLPFLRTIESAPHEVALSIDDGPTPETTPGILERLRRSDARATFFLTGIRAAQFPQLVGNIVHEGHEVFAHGWEHVSLAKASWQEIAQAMQRCEDLLRAHRPTPSPYLVRLPYGSGHRSAHVHRALKRWSPDCQIAHWRLLFEDFRLPPLCRRPEDVGPLCARTVACALTADRLPGAILVCHDAPFDVTGEHKALVTLRFIEEVLSALRMRALTAVPVRPSTRPHTVGRYVLG